MPDASAADIRVRRDAWVTPDGRGYAVVSTAAGAVLARVEPGAVRVVARLAEEDAEALALWLDAWMPWHEERVRG